jgi:PPOX class probable F420-dependent enzyme
VRDDRRRPEDAKVAEPECAERPGQRRSEVGLLRGTAFFDGAKLGLRLGVGLGLVGGDDASDRSVGLMGVNQRAEIKMSDAEIDEFLHGRHTMSVATISHDGSIHVVAMWYGFLPDGSVAFETKAKSQKVQNLKRDPKMTCMVEDGVKYEELRGVELAGTGELIDDYDTLFALAVDLTERYYNVTYTDDMKPMVEAMMNKRVVVKIAPERTVSWDHGKLGASVPTSS